MVTMASDQPSYAARARYADPEACNVRDALAAWHAAPLLQQPSWLPKDAVPPAELLLTPHLQQLHQQLSTLQLQQRQLEHRLLDLPPQPAPPPPPLPTPRPRRSCRIGTEFARMNGPSLVAMNRSGRTRCLSAWSCWRATRRLLGMLCSQSHAHAQLPMATPPAALAV